MQVSQRGSQHTDTQQDGNMGIAPYLRAPIRSPVTVPCVLMETKHSSISSTHKKGMCHPF